MRNPDLMTYEKVYRTRPSGGRPSSSSIGKAESIAELTEEEEHLLYGLPISPPLELPTAEEELSTAEEESSSDFFVDISSQEATAAGGTYADTSSSTPTSTVRRHDTPQVKMEWHNALMRGSRSLDASGSGDKYYASGVGQNNTPDSSPVMVTPEQEQRRRPTSMDSSTAYKEGKAFVPMSPPLPITPPNHFGGTSPFREPNMTSKPEYQPAPFQPWPGTKPRHKSREQEGGCSPQQQDVLLRSPFEDVGQMLTLPDPDVFHQGTESLRAPPPVQGTSRNEEQYKEAVHLEQHKPPGSSIWKLIPCFSGCNRRSDDHGTE
eukprot:gene13794-19703_t